MGFTSAEAIEDGAKYLLSILSKEPEIKYSRFFDGSEETSKQLADGIGLDEDERDWYSAEHIIDLAVYELEEQGIVSREELSDQLCDGTNDYKIILAPRGKMHLVRPIPLKFWPAE